MNKNSTDNSSQKNDAASKDRSNLGYKKPNPNAPKQDKNHQVGEDDENNPEEITAKTASKGTEGNRTSSDRTNQMRAEDDETNERSGTRSKENRDNNMRGE